MATEGLQEMRDALNVLRRELREAYWATTNKEDGDRITAIADWCADTVMELDAQSIEDRTAAYGKLKAEFKRSKERLKSVQDDIDRIVHRVAQAQKAASALDKAITLAVKYL